MRNVLWYGVSALSFYAFLSFYTGHAYLTGHIQSAMQALQVGVLVAAVNVFVLGGYYLGTKTAGVMGGIRRKVGV